MEEKIREYIKNEGIFLPKNLIINLYSQILKFAGGLSGIIQVGAREAGKKAGENFKEFLKDKNYNIEEVLKIFFEETNLGKIEVKKLENGYEVNVIDSVFLNAHPNVEVSLKPVVGAIEGFLSGFEGCEYSSKIKGKTIILTKKGG